jgi:hypothetical protein
VTDSYDRAEASPAPAGLASAASARTHLTQTLHDALCATTDARGCTRPCLRATAAVEAWVIEHFSTAVALTDPCRYLDFRVVGPWGTDSATDEADARAQVAQARTELPSRADDIYWVATPVATWDDGSHYTGEDQTFTHI